MPITELALLNTFTSLLWQLKAVQQADGSSSAAGQSSSGAADRLGERVVTFCVQLESIFETSGDLQRLQDCVFRIQADLFLVFSTTKLNVGSCLLCSAQLHSRTSCSLALHNVNAPKPPFMVAFRLEWQPTYAWLIVLHAHIRFVGNANKLQPASWYLSSVRRPRSQYLSVLFSSAAGLVHAGGCSRGCWVQAQ